MAPRRNTHVKRPSKVAPLARAKPAAIARAKPAAKPRAKPAAKPRAKPTAKPGATPTPKPARAKSAPKARAKSAAKPAAKPRAKAHAKAATKSTAKARATSAAKSRAKPAEPSTKPEAIPQPVAFESSNEESSSRSRTARERALRSSPVVEILDDPHPIGALRRFLDSIKGQATAQQAQIALGSAQLMLMPIARENRGGAEVKELVDLVAEYWDSFGDRRVGFHAQEFLREAFTALGIDRARIAKLEELIPADATAEVLFGLAAAHAAARDKVAMLRAVEAALRAGATPAQFRRDRDFAVYKQDPELALVLSRAEIPPIPVDVEPYVPAVRDALDRLVTTLREFGEPLELNPPLRIDAILDAERAGKVSLPNDYRALLTITNGMTLWDHVFFGAGDYRESTPLAQRARRFLETLAEPGALGPAGSSSEIECCVPLASWSQPSGWLLYDPRGPVRGGEPGYVLVHETDALPIRDLAAALARIEYLAHETLGTN